MLQLITEWEPWIGKKKWKNPFSTLLGHMQTSHQHGTTKPHARFLQIIIQHEESKGNSDPSFKKKVFCKDYICNGILTVIREDYALTTD